MNNSNQQIIMNRRNMTIYFRMFLNVLLKNIINIDIGGKCQI